MSKNQKKKKGRGGTYRREEIDRILSSAEQKHSMGLGQWEAVAIEYNIYFPQNPRDAESLQTKYKSLKNAKKPTGDPECPVPMRRVKRLQRELSCRCQLFLLTTRKARTLVQKMTPNPQI